MGFPCGSAGKESTRNAGDLGLIPGLGRFPGEGNGYPLQCSGLESRKESDTMEQLSLSLSLFALWKFCTRNFLSFQHLNPAHTLLDLHLSISLFLSDYK